MSNAKQQFTTYEKFYCQWTGGAKEYFNTIEEAIEKANSHFTKSGRKSDESLAYWQTQKFLIGKELVVVQQLDIISYNCPVY